MLLVLTLVERHWLENMIKTQDQLHHHSQYLKINKLL